MCSSQMTGYAEVIPISDRTIACSRFRFNAKTKRRLDINR
jgi:hypothetical protein